MIENSTPKPTTYRANVLGGIGLAFVLLWWLPFILPKRTATPLISLLDRIGPFQWLLLLGMVALPVMAAKRGSKWWLSVSGAGVLTLIVVVRAWH